MAEMSENDAQRAVFAVEQSFFCRQKPPIRFPEFGIRRESLNNMTYRVVPFMNIGTYLAVRQTLYDYTGETGYNDILETHPIWPSPVTRATTYKSVDYTVQCHFEMSTIPPLTMPGLSYKPVPLQVTLHQPETVHLPQPATPQTPPGAFQNFTPPRQIYYNWTPSTPTPESAKKPFSAARNLDFVSLSPPDDYDASDDNDDDMIQSPPSLSQPSSSNRILPELTGSSVAAAMSGSSDISSVADQGSPAGPSWQQGLDNLAFVTPESTASNQPLWSQMSGFSDIPPVVDSGSPAGPLALSSPTGQQGFANPGFMTPKSTASNLPPPTQSARSVSAGPRISTPEGAGKQFVSFEQPRSPVPAALTGPPKTRPSRSPRRTLMRSSESPMSQTSSNERGSSATYGSSETKTTDSSSSSNIAAPGPRSVSAGPLSRSSPMDTGGSTSSTSGGFITVSPRSAS